MFDGFDDPAPIEPSAELLAAVHGRAARRHRRAVATVAATALAVVGLGVGVAAVYGRDRGTPVAVRVGSSTTVAPEPTARITSRLELPATIPAGSTVTGTLVIENHTANTVDLSQFCGNWRVQLGTTKPPTFVMFAKCVIDPFALRPGVNRMPFSLFGGYVQCSSDGAGGMQKCRTDGSPPVMAPGLYHAYFLGGPRAFAAYAPEPVDVLVVSPPAAARSVTSRLELPATIAAGRDALGTLVIVNATNQTITLERHGCWWSGIILTTMSEAPGPHSTPGCPTPLVLAPGENRITVGVRIWKTANDGSGCTCGAPYPVGRYAAWLDPSAAADPITPDPVLVEVVAG
jgi:hypothetical protein